MILLRRVLLASVPALALAACAGSPTPSQLASDAGLIAQGLASAVAAWSGMAGIPAATAAAVQGYLAQIQTAAAQLAASTAGDNLSAVQGIAALVAQVASAVLPLVPGGSAIVPRSSGVETMPSPKWSK